jgi:hypothetical protein
MTGINSKIDQLAHDAKATAAKVSEVARHVADTALSATEKAAESSREVAREAFDKIKAARDAAAHKLD